MCRSKTDANGRLSGFLYEGYSVHPRPVERWPHGLTAMNPQQTPGGRCREWRRENIVAAAGAGQQAAPAVGNGHHVERQRPSARVPPRKAATDGVARRGTHTAAPATRSMYWPCRCGKLWMCHSRGRENRAGRRSCRCGSGRHPLRKDHTGKEPPWVWIRVVIPATWDWKPDIDSSAAGSGQGLHGPRPLGRLAVDTWRIQCSTGRQNHVRRRGPEYRGAWGPSSPLGS